jgi:hypothetical protein
MESPQFCPWCGSPSAYRREGHTPAWKVLAEIEGVEPPAFLKEALPTAAFVTGCPGCRHLTHVIGHAASARP